MSGLDWTCRCGHGLGSHEIRVVPSVRLGPIVNGTAGQCRSIAYGRLGAAPCYCPRYETTVSAGLWR